MMLRIELVVVVESSYMEPESMSNTIDLAKNRRIFWYKVVTVVICRNMVVNQQVAIRIEGGTHQQRKDKIDR